ncbi:hypothetical protein O0I10_005342 [Lichtheimia ornata]|uniref:Uncharacterized protein n=1 Tax=Lichtheimia ornata TaxID=688661 RepID=A0AAD7V529_9FUNG|nr:uncharacterized protein O0I10_005342 [Lichtheimia ornata]KAJ8658960.1 hypothetical protein O0I10_005342 [Lichtheimia ornata]
MHTHSLALIATVCLVSITSHAAPLAIKRDSQQPQGGTLAGLTSQTSAVTKGTAPLTGPANGFVASVLAAGGSAQSLIPANSQDGLTADTQVTTTVNGLAGSLDNLTGGGGGQQKQEA